MRQSFLAYCAYVFPGFKAPAHVVQIAQALERIERGELKRLIVTLPPRHFKSSMICQLFASWYIGRNPDRKIINAAYGEALTHRNSKGARDLVKNPKFQRIFPGIKISDHSDSAAEWQLEGRKGGYKTSSVGGALTGFGAHLLLIDDPHKNREEANNQYYRDRVFDWYQSDAYSRLEPTPAEGAIVVLHTRFHVDDLIGRLLKEQEENPGADQWEVIHLPAIDEDGVPLYWSLEEYHRARETAGPFNWASLWQGQPYIPGGEIFRSEWINFEKRAPDLHWVRYWDVAIGVKTSNDFTSGALVGLGSRGEIWIKDIRRIKGTYPEIKAAIVGQTELDPPGTVLGLPLDMVGKSLGQELRSDPRMLRVPLRTFREKGDKVERAAVWQSRAAEGLLYVVEGPWNDEFIKELLQFPNAKHDDQIDSVSGAVELVRLAKGGERERPADLKENTYEYFEAIVAEANRVRDELARFEDAWV